MKASLLGVYVSATIIICGALSACGGGSDDGAGGLTPFSVSPDSAGLTWDGTTCGSAKVADFTIVGGTAPYTLLSSLNPGPSAVVTLTFSSQTVGNRNTQFSAFASGCMDPGVITILDGQSRRLTVEVTSTAASAP
jgi:hypothetical protein